MNISKEAKVFRDVHKLRGKESTWHLRKEVMRVLICIDRRKNTITNTKPQDQSTESST